MAKKKNVIITGAAGLVGTILRQHWGNRYALRLADARLKTCRQMKNSPN